MTKSMSYIFNEARLNVRGSNPALNKKIEKNPGFFTITLSHSRLRSPAFFSTTKRKGWGVKDLFYWFICICYYVNRKRKSTRKGEGRDGS